MGRIKVITPWATLEELHFISNIMMHTTPTFQAEHEPLEGKCILLENYIKASKQRTDWGEVNAQQVILFAQKELAEKQAELKKREGKSA
jgi:hypothetical protein